jgi:hypothetical protein
LHSLTAQRMRWAFHHLLQSYAKRCCASHNFSFALGALYSDPIDQKFNFYSDPSFRFKS